MQFAHNAFFNLLGSYLGPNINMVQWVAEVLQCSETNAWRKVNGTRGLQISEMLALCAAEPRLAIEGAELFPWHQLKVVQIRSFVNAAEFHAYLEAIELMFNEAEKYEDFRMRYVARDLPLFYFLGHAAALKHKFKLWTMGEKRATEMLPLSTLNLAQRLFTRYQELPTEEIWYDQAFQVQYDQLEFFENCGDLDQPEADEIRSYYKEMEERRQLWIKRAKKTEGGELLAAACPVALNNNGALMHFNAKEQLLGSIMSVQYFYSHNQRLIDQFNTLWTKQLRWCPERPERMLYLDMRYHEERRAKLDQKAS